MNKSETRNRMVRAWLNYSYSTNALEWHLKRAYTEKLEDLPLFARNWKGENDID